MLTRIRDRLASLLEKTARGLAKAHVKPNYLTISSLAVILAGFYILYTLKNIFLFIIMIILSSTLDMLDGALARYTGSVTKFGAFLDSTIDRVNDFIVIIGLNYIGFKELVVYTLLITSLLISYVRARAEGLGLEIEGVGVIERAERILFLIAIYFTAIYNMCLARILLLVLLALSIITLVQRIVYTYKSFRH